MTLVVLVQALCVEEIDVGYCGVRDTDSYAVRRCGWRGNRLRFERVEILSALGW